MRYNKAVCEIPCGFMLLKSFAGSLATHTGEKPLATHTGEKPLAKHIQLPLGQLYMKVWSLQI